MFFAHVCHVHSARETGWDASQETAAEVNEALPILSQRQHLPPLQVFIQLCCLPV
jgi:hypothetical protein